MSTTQEHGSIPGTAVEFAPITDVDLALAAELAQQLRVDSIRSSTSAGSGHPTSSMSAADLLAVLVAAPPAMTGTTPVTGPTTT